MADKDFYGLRNTKGTYMIPLVSQGKTGLISPKKVQQIESKIQDLYNKLASLDPSLGESPMFVEVDSIDEVSEQQRVYFVKKDDEDDVFQDSYDEYMLINDVPEKIGGNSSEKINATELEEITSYFQY